MASFISKWILKQVYTVYQAQPEPGTTFGWCGLSTHLLNIMNLLSIYGSNELCFFYVLRLSHYFVFRNLEV